MRFLLTYCIAFIATVSISAQNKQLLYGLENVPQSLMLNPGGEVYTQKHIGVPLLSGIHINAGMSGLTAFDIFEDDGRDINDKIRNQILELSPKDFFTLTQQIELANIGWRSQFGAYFTAGWYQEMDFIAYFPKDIAILATEGNRDYINYPFDISHINVRGDVTSVFHIGINKQVNKKLTIGIRGKLYSSIVSANSTRNKGTFTTVNSTNGLNVYEHRVEDVDVNIRTSGLNKLLDLNGNEIGVVKKMLGRSIFSGNYGLGVDLGFTYLITDKMRLSASALDIGAIFHMADIETINVSGDYSLNGIELVYPQVENGEELIPYYDDLKDDVYDNLNVETTRGAYLQTRPLKINAQLSYNFGNFLGGDVCDCLKRGLIRRVNETGVHLYAIARPRGPQTAGTFFYRRRFGANFSLKGSYTIDSYSSDNIGAAISLDINKFNFYIAADNLLRLDNLAKANSVSLQLGLNLKWDQE